ncbi:unnamed protein product [Meloidogyne enterolobii]|uniref:Uncharacterized protein n=1 Tax=Meloidogyne enterolobii TaxID=390850 RepID=A0ACB0ZC77_MELEN
MIVPEITLIFSTPPNFKLNKKAEKVFNYQLNNVKYTYYQISNIYNPKLKFYFYIEEPEENGYTYNLRIIKV